MSAAHLPSADGLAHFGAPSASFNAIYFSPASGECLEERGAI